MEGDIYFGDLEFIPSHKKLYIPRGNKKTNEFFITVLSVEEKFQAEDKQNIGK